MKPTITTTGTDELRRRLDAMRAQMGVVGEVYWRGARNVKLGRIHAAGTDALPARNPWFVQPGTALRVQVKLRRGVADIARGVSSGIRQAMGEACRLVADGFRRNIAPAGRLSAKHVGLHAPEGVAVSEGTRMARLSRAYAKAKDKSVGPRPVLVDTGELYDSVAYRVVG